MGIEALNKEVAKARIIYQTTPGIGQTALVNALIKRGKYYQQHDQADQAKLDFEAVKYLIRESESIQNNGDLDEFLSELGAFDPQNELGLDNQVSELSRQTSEAVDLKNRQNPIVTNSIKANTKIVPLAVSLGLAIITIIILAINLSESDSWGQFYYRQYWDAEKQIELNNKEINARDLGIITLQSQIDDLQKEIVILEEENLILVNEEVLLGVLLDFGYSNIGPLSGYLIHNSGDNFPETKSVGIDVPNAIIKATFVNPFAATDHSWDIGFYFRHTGYNKQYRLIVESNGDVSIVFKNGESSEIVAVGHATQFYQNAQDENEIILLFRDKSCIVMVNRELVINNDTLEDTRPGWVMIGTGLLNGNEVDGEITIYTDFKIWSID